LRERSPGTRVAGLHRCRTCQRRAWAWTCGGEIMTSATVSDRGPALGARRRLDAHRLQYRLLKRIAPGRPTQMSGRAYRGRSKLPCSWRGSTGSDPRLRRTGLRLRGRCRGGPRWRRSPGPSTDSDIVTRLLEQAAARAPRRGRLGALRVRKAAAGAARRRDRLARFVRALSGSGRELEADVSAARPEVASSRLRADLVHPYGGHLFSCFLGAPTLQRRRR